MRGSYHKELKRSGASRSAARRGAPAGSSEDAQEAPKSSAKRKPASKKSQKRNGKIDGEDADDDYGGSGSSGYESGEATAADAPTTTESTTKTLKAKKEVLLKLEQDNAYEYLISEAVEEMGSSRPDVRVKGTKQMLKVMRSGLTEEIRTYILEGYIETLTTLLIRYVNKAASADAETETILLMKVICTMSLLMGPDEEEFFVKFETPLKKLVESCSMGDTVQSQALFTLSFCAFICSNRADETWEFVEDTLCNGPDEISDLPFIQACRSWVLLSSCAEDSAILERSRDRVFTGVSRILEFATEIEGRIAAGHCLAYLFEVAYRANQDSVNPNDAGAFLSTKPTVLQRTLDKLQATSKESSKRVSKRDKKEQRAVFRDIQHVVFERIPPKDSIRFSGATVTPTTFQQLALLDDLKSVLGDGFQTALRSYPVVCQILEVDFFDAAADEEHTKGKKNKVTKGSKEERRRALDRRQDTNATEKASFFDE